MFRAFFVVRISDYEKVPTTRKSLVENLNFTQRRCVNIILITFFVIFIFTLIIIIIIVA